jgi:hypothetical protein
MLSQEVRSGAVGLEPVSKPPKASLADERASEGEEGHMHDRVALPADAQAPVVVQPREGTLDGLIAKDKFCMTRHGRLPLRRSRRRTSKTHSQISKPADGRTYPPAGITQHGGAHEAPVAHLPRDRAASGCPGALGPSLPERSAVESGSPAGVRSERER